MTVTIKVTRLLKVQDLKYNLCILIFIYLCVGVKCERVRDGEISGPKNRPGHWPGTGTGIPDQNINFFFKQCCTKLIMLLFTNVINIPI